MGLFSRRRTTDRPEGEPIADFWTWWTASGADETATAIEAREPLRAADELSRRVSAIDDGLAWELAAGHGSQHLLVVSPEGSPELRATARRWLKAAPVASPTWEFADTRQPVEDPSGVLLEIGGTEASFADVVVGARRDGVRLAVSVHHPVFRVVDDRTRLTIAFLALDAAIGEADVEMWVGEVTPVVEPPLDGFPLIGLRAVVRDLKAEHTSENGEPHYVMLEAEGREGTILALAQVPLSAASAPELDTHVAVFLPYSVSTAQGLPGPGSLEALRAFEDDLLPVLGSHGRLVAHQSHGGTRVLHLYVDGTASVTDRVTEAASRWTEGRASVTSSHDPAWETVSHLRG